MMHWFRRHGSDSQRELTFIPLSLDATGTPQEPALPQGTWGACTQQTVHAETNLCLHRSRRTTADARRGTGNSRASKEGGAPQNGSLLMASIEGLI